MTAAEITYDEDGYALTTQGQEALGLRRRTGHRS